MTEAVRSLSQSLIDQRLRVRIVHFEAIVTPEISARKMPITSSPRGPLKQFIEPDFKGY